MNNVKKMLLLGMLGGDDPLLKSLVASWHLDEASGNATDATGRGNTLVAHNNPLGVAGHIGNARQCLSASQQALYILNNADTSLNPGSWTISSWIYPLTVATAYTICKGTASTGEYSLIVLTNKFNFFLMDGSGTVKQLGSSVTLEVNTWYHTVLRHDAVNKVIYINVNNTKNSSSAYLGTPSASTDDLTIGMLRTISPGSSFNGLFDEINIWKRCLTDVEVTRLYG